jgi:hypothetical protein
MRSVTSTRLPNGTRRYAVPDERDHLGTNSEGAAHAGANT